MLIQMWLKVMFKHLEKIDEQDQDKINQPKLFGFHNGNNSTTEIGL